MKIVHVITRLIRGGAEENTVLTCNWFAEAGHDVTLLHGNEWDDDLVRQVDPRIERICVPELCREISLARDLRAAFIVRSLLRQAEPDVVHTHESKAGVIGRLAAIWLPGCLVVHGIHILPFLNVGPWRRLFFLALERLVAPTTHGFISVSDVLRQSAIAHGLGGRERHYVVPSGMDIAKFIAARGPGRSLEDRPLEAIYVANYEPRKRHLELLKMLARRRNEFAGAVRFHFCGRGYLLAECEHFALEHGLSDIVSIDGLISDPEHAIAHADVGIYCSSHEGLPRAIVQYCAVGKPVVAMALPGLELLVRDNQNGVVLPQGDFDSLGDALLRFARENSELVRMSTASERLESAEWASDRMCARIACIYEALGAPIVGPDASASFAST